MTRLPDQRHLGELLDEEAKVLEESKLMGAAVDYEPLDQGSSPRRLDNVLLMRHCAVGGDTPEPSRISAIKFIYNIAR